MSSVHNIGSVVALVIISSVGLWMVAHDRPHVAPTADLLPLRQSVSLMDTAIQGSDEAPVTVLEFADFECPFCRTFARETLPAIRTTLLATGVVRFGFKQLPLASIHRAALPAAILAECARRKGLFWEAHDLLFAGRRGLELSAVGAAAATPVLSLAGSSCLNEDGASRVKDDGVLAAALGVNSTPTFLIGRTAPNNTVIVTRKAKGAMSAAEFARLVEAVRQDGVGGVK